MTIKPINDNIIVELPCEEKETKTKSGIVLLKNNTEKSSVSTGTVVAVGRGRILNDGSVIEPSVKIGDTVIFDSYAGTELKADSKTYSIIKENNILGVY